MPAQEVQQPQAQQMELPAQDAGRTVTEQPRPTEEMTMRGGDEGADICCGLCAGLACFECLNCCC